MVKPFRFLPTRTGIRWTTSTLICLAFLHAARSLADVQAPAVPILEKLVAATGGSEARANQRTLRVKGRIEAIGLTGRWELLLAAPDRWTRRFTLGSLRFREGYDGEVAWRTDLSGKHVTIQDASAIEDAREEGWFLNERWALADQGGARIRRGSRSFGTSGDYDVLEITPPSGQPRRFHVNAQTGFVERMTFEKDQHIVEERPGGYKKLGGRMRASVYQSPTLLPGDKPIQRLTVDSVTVNPPLAATAFSPPELTERPISWQGAHDAIRVPFSYGSKAVLVKVSINGATPADFILDTGASLTAIDIHYARSIGIQPEGDAAVQGIAATGAMRFGKVQSIALAGRGSRRVGLRDFRAALLDFAEGSRPVLWKKANGLLGYDFLNRFVVEIDYDSLIVRLHDPAGFRYRGSGQAIPFELHQGVPVVEMTLDGDCTGRFLVDVGNSFHTTVHGSMVRECGMLRDKRRKQVQVSGGGIGGGFSSTLCRLDSLRLGPFSWTEPVAALALHTRGMIGSKDYAGNIGNDLLERFRCTYDYAHRTLYLEPGRRYGHRDKVSRLGVMLVRLEHQVYAGTVITGSSGYEAGLRWYDEILSIDGRPALEWTREELDRVLEEGEVGSVHKIKYRRWLEGEKTVEVKLRDVL